MQVDGGLRKLGSGAMSKPPKNKPRNKQYKLTPEMEAVQWKKGQSGNPKGRPKGAKEGLRAKLRRALKKQAPEHVIQKLESLGFEDLDADNATAVAITALTLALGGNEKMIDLLFKQTENPLKQSLEVAQVPYEQWLAGLKDECEEDEL